MIALCPSECGPGHLCPVHVIFHGGLVVVCADEDEFELWVLGVDSVVEFDDGGGGVAAGGAPVGAVINHEILDFLIGGEGVGDGFPGGLVEFYQVIVQGAGKVLSA